MTAYTVTTGGDYSWSLGNGLCTQQSGNMDITETGCGECGSNTFTVSMTCDSTNPASYTVNADIHSPATGSTYVIGTNMGPITPFSGTFPGTGTYALTLTFTTLSIPPPDSVKVEVLITLTAVNVSKR